MTISYRLESRALFVRPNEGLSKPKPVVFLSVEGTNTEISYFNYVKNIKKNFVVNYLPHIDVAIVRSKDFAEFDSLLHELSTNVGDLFKILRETK